MRKQIMVSVFFVAALSATAHSAQPDDAWLAWVGCWRADGAGSERSLCIVPEGDGVRMITLNAGRIESESRIVADGQPRSISQEGCSGTETARWSADRQRVFLRADLNCGNNVSRKVSGVFAMLAGSQWVSVQSIATAGTQRLHTVRYVESQPTTLPEEIAQAFRDNRLARETVRLAAAAPLDLDDVKESVKNVEPTVVEGWLTVVGQEFDLHADALIELADAGVPASVIDVLVAVSNPGHFAVRAERANERDDRMRGRPTGCFDSYWNDPYDPFGYRGSYYGGGRCGGFGFYPWGGYYGGGNVIVIDRGSTRSRGKVTKAGYKAPRDGSAIGTSTTTTSKTSTPKSSGDSDSSSGSSSGGGRKAKPRDN
jgi:hypothetical protein